MVRFCNYTYNLSLPTLIYNEKGDAAKNKIIVSYSINW